MDAKSLISAYFQAFNDGQTDRMLDLLHEDIEHHVNEGRIRKGKALFLPLRQALTGMDHGPDMGELLPLIGEARARERLEAAAQA